MILMTSFVEIPLQPSIRMSLPRTLGELQLYRVLQRANLLMYYDTFIQQGGDDVQQLCEAGEEEFLEIMALVGMATKPLHVRRLQKALRDWASNPTLFNQPLATNVAPCGIPLLRIDSTSIAGSGVMGARKSLSNGQPGSPCEREEVGSCLTPLRDNSPKSPCSQASPVPPDHLYREKLSPMDPHWLSPEMYGAAELDEEQPILPFACHSRLLGPPTPTSSSSPSTTTSPWPGGQLDTETVKAVEESVDRLLRTMPQADQTEVKTLLRLNKKMAKTVGHIFNLEPQDKSKEEEIRKYSLIYGRFDSKRREGKQLTHHEMLINEAAAQFCIRDNALLLRRVELFSLARQVARECAYTSTFKHNRTYSDDCAASVDYCAQKRIKLDVTDSDRLSKDPVANSDNRSTADDNSLSGESLDSLTHEMEEKVSERRGSSNRSSSPANTKDDP
ncbi:NGFI-A-binding protein 2-like isoform X3 [Carassius carassius]|uniref:NGFI-A-binding protein 2-like isoform X3 n=1 Tax=Carassius carassius TaxID=217509 RepID=UPI0028683C89|nr:NGFI-A-binding protein 2-like isoform X3 [Carassius carassius]